MDFLNEIKRLKSISDIGLFYSKDNYDRERYETVRDISQSLLAHLINQPLSILTDFYINPLDYPTPKVDIRALVLNEKMEILMVQEQTDGFWALPGGWADIGSSPKEVAIKEVAEETGLAVDVKTLLAVFDKRCHPHPPEANYVYKLVFGCQYTEGGLAKGFDILDVNFFPIHQLPPLSKQRILDTQIQLVFQKWVNKDAETYFD